MSQHSTPFSIELADDGSQVRVNEDLIVECVHIPQGWLVNGRLRDTPCVFGEILNENPDRPFTFTMLSVSGVELQATVSPQAEQVTPAGKAHYVA